MNFRFLSHSLFGQSRPGNYCLPDCSIFRSRLRHHVMLKKRCGHIYPEPHGYAVVARLFQPSVSLTLRLKTCMVISLVSWSTVTRSLCEGRQLGHQPELQARCVQQRDHRYHQRSVRLSREATLSPWPSPTIIDDKDSISGIPGPPLGPGKRTTTTSPSTISSERTPQWQLLLSQRP